jgi:hypothetical protein
MKKAGQKAFSRPQRLQERKMKQERRSTKGNTTIITTVNDNDNNIRIIIVSQVDLTN